MYPRIASACALGDGPVGLGWVGWRVGSVLGEGRGMVDGGWNSYTEAVVGIISSESR